MADVISRGRLEIGFLKSGDSEMASGNANPIGIVERFWEAIDLIVKTLTSHEGPFSWEGKHFTHRHVNVWPPCFQRPHPQLWAATGDPETSRELGRRVCCEPGPVFRGDALSQGCGRRRSVDDQGTTALPGAHPGKGIWNVLEPDPIGD